MALSVKKLYNYKNKYNIIFWHRQLNISINNQYILKKKLKMLLYIGLEVEIYITSIQK